LTRGTDGEENGEKEKKPEGAKTPKSPFDLYQRLQLLRFTASFFLGYH
jgi:hypothetical protein